MTRKLSNQKEIPTPRTDVGKELNKQQGTVLILRKHTVNLHRGLTFALGFRLVIGRSGISIFGYLTEAVSPRF